MRIAKAIALAILTLALPLHAQQDCHDLMAALNISESNAQLTARLAEFYHNSVLTSPDAEHIRRHMKGLYDQKRNELAETLGVPAEDLQKAIEHHIDKKRGTVQRKAKTPNKNKLATLAGDWFEIASLEHKNWPSRFDISADGKTLLTVDVEMSSEGGPSPVKLWDMNGKSLHTLEGHEQFTRAILSPDGKKALSYSHDATAKLWDSDTGDLLATLDKHNKPISGVQGLGDG
jgi:WD40 repeat protein